MMAAQPMPTKSKPHPCSPTMRRILASLIERGVGNHEIPPDNLYDDAGVPHRLGEAALTRLINEGYLMATDSDGYWSTFFIPAHVMHWWEQGAPAPGPSLSLAVPTISVRCPKIFLESQDPNTYDRN